MKSIKAIFVLSGILLLNIGVYAQAPNTKSERKELASAFNQRHENRWRIRFNETTGTTQPLVRGFGIPVGN